MSLTKEELANALADELGMTKSDAKKLVENFFEEISLALERGEEIKLSGFGNFALKDKGARPGRNPKTGEPVEISSRRVVTFKQGQKLKSQVSEVTLPLKEIES